MTRRNADSLPPERWMAGVELGPRVRSSNSRDDGTGGSTGRLVRPGRGRAGAERSRRRRRPRPCSRTHGSKCRRRRSVQGERPCWCGPAGKCWRSAATRGCARPARIARRRRASRSLTARPTTAARVACDRSVAGAVRVGGHRGARRRRLLLVAGRPASCASRVLSCSRHVDRAAPTRGALDGYGIERAGHGLVAFSRSDEHGSRPDWLLDVATRTWTEAPPRIRCLPHTTAPWCGRAGRLCCSTTSWWRTQGRSGPRSLVPLASTSRPRRGAACPTRRSSGAPHGSPMAHASSTRSSVAPTAARSTTGAAPIRTVASSTSALRRGPRFPTRPPATLPSQLASWAPTVRSTSASRATCLISAVAPGTPCQRWTASRPSSTAALSPPAAICSCSVACGGPAPRAAPRRRVDTPRGAR